MALPSPISLMFPIGVFVSSLTGCTPSTSERLVAPICDGKPASGAAPRSLRRIQVGRISVVLPDGFKAIAIAGAGEQEGVRLVGSRQEIAVSSGFWGETSFPKLDGSFASPACKIDIGGIPVSVYAQSGGEIKEAEGRAFLAAIAQPESPKGRPNQRTLLISSLVNDADPTQVAALQAVVLSVRRVDDSASEQPIRN